MFNQAFVDIVLVIIFIIFFCINSFLLYFLNIFPFMLVIIMWNCQIFVSFPSMIDNQNERQYVMMIMKQSNCFDVQSKHVAIITVLPSL